MATEAQILAEEARMLRENRVFKQVFQEIGEEIIEALRGCPLGEERELRDELVLSLQVLDKVNQQVQDKIDTLALEEATK